MAATLFAAARSEAAVLFDSGGFEPTAGYAAGVSLAGQPATGLNKFGSSVPATDTTVTGSVQTYQTVFPGSTVTSNTQLAVVQATNTRTSGLFFPVANDPQAGGTAYNASTSIIDVTFQMAVTASAGDPLFGITVLNGAGTADVAELLIDGTSGQVVGGTSFETVPTGATAFRDYELQVNYITQMYYLYSAPLGTTAFTSANLIDSNSFLSPSTAFGGAALTETPGTTSNVTGTGLFDNYVVTAVPEPTTASLAVGGLALLAGGRRRRKAAASR